MGGEWIAEYLKNKEYTLQIEIFFKFFKAVVILIKLGNPDLKST